MYVRVTYGFKRLTTNHFSSGNGELDEREIYFSFCYANIYFDTEFQPRNIYETRISGT